MASGINSFSIEKSVNPDMQGKISFVGCPAVGKTTLMKMLCQKPVSKQYLPTQGFDLGSVSFNGFKLRMWDFGGQKAYLKNSLSQYIHGSDLIFIVTDSTPKNVLTTKELVAHAQSLMPEESCRIVAIANKQDLDGHLTPARVKDVLQIPTFGLTAIDPTQRNLLIEIITIVMEEIQKERDL